MLNPCPKTSASPSCRFGSIASAYTCRCTWSGVRMTTTLASAAASAGVTTRRPSASARARLPLPSGRPTPAAAALGQTDADVDARVAQVQGVRVPLAAVADDRDLAVGQGGQVGVGVVVHLGHGAALLG